MIFLFWTQLPISLFSQTTNHNLLNTSKLQIHIKSRQKPSPKCHEHVNPCPPSTLEIERPHYYNTNIDTISQAIILIPLDIIHEFDRKKFSSLHEDQCLYVKVDTNIPLEFPILEGILL
jgi:hypothetical protein